MTPGVYLDIPAADYHRIQAVSASLLCAMIERCPRAAWAGSWMNPDPLPEEHSAETDIGTIGHAILLHTEEFVEVIDPADHPAKTGGIPIGWTNASIRKARDDARSAGRIPVLVSQMGEIRAMVASVRQFVDSLRVSEPAIWAAFQSGAGDSEVSMVWEDRGGLLCRCRPDRINVKRDVIVDAKFTGRSAHPDTWARSQFVGMGYADRAAFYRRGCRELFGVEASYVFLVCETTAPYLCSLVGLDPGWIAYGDANVDAALHQWRRCVERGEWPAYPSRVAYPQLPGWLAAQVEQREVERVGEVGGWQKLYGEMPT